MKRASLLLLMMLMAVTVHAASLWQSTSFAVGGQGRWLYSGPVKDDDEFEGAANAAISLTPHVSITGGVAYGFQDSYTRSQVDARITATDADDANFNIWLGAGRYFSKHPSDGLDEWAGKAGIGYRPLRDRPFVLGLTSAYGFDTGRQSLTAGLYYAFKLARGDNDLRR